jgi:hypothetical protein
LKQELEIEVHEFGFQCSLIKKNSMKDLGKHFSMHHQGMTGLTIPQNVSGILLATQKEGGSSNNSWASE